MNALAPNPKTGFLESRNPSLAGFTSDKKQKFLELARQAAEMGSAPSMPNLCKTIGIGHVTFHDHLKADAVFKRAWEDTLDIIEDCLVQTMVTNGQRPSGYMDRITWLRANRPGKWNPDWKGQTPNDSEGHKSLISEFSTIIDAEVVENPVKSPELPVNNPDSIPKGMVS